MALPPSDKSTVDIVDGIGITFDLVSVMVSDTPVICACATKVAVAKMAMSNDFSFMMFPPFYFNSFTKVVIIYAF